MSTVTTFRSLSKDRQRLVQLMTEVQFGVITGLHFNGGEPDFSLPPVIYRRHHFGTGKEHRAAKLRADFVLKAALVDFFALCDRLVTFEIDELKVENGLPQVLCTVEDAVV